MRKVVLAALTAATIAVAVPATAQLQDAVNDRKDTITCPSSTQEDDQLIRSFVRLEDGRARIVFSCPS